MAQINLTWLATKDSVVQKRASTRIQTIPRVNKSAGFFFFLDEIPSKKKLALLPCIIKDAKIIYDDLEQKQPDHH